MIRFITVVFVLLLAACGKAPPDGPSVPSPLIGADSDRLWILARASKVGDGRECKELYLNPEDPRYRGLAQKCDAWSRDYADYLAINGFPIVEYLHLQDPAYWRWYLEMRQQISDCKERLGNLPIGLRDADRRRQHQYDRNECDPYTHVTNNEGVAPNALGIRHN